MSELELIRSELNENKDTLAFVIGNGTNRHAYGNMNDCSWESILYRTWNSFSDYKIQDTNKIEGVSLTELYDIVTDKGSDKQNVRNFFCKQIENLHPTEFHKILQQQFIQWDVPVLTTNFDTTLEDGLTRYKLPTSQRFTDYYPCNEYVGVPRSLQESSSPLNSFGIWHIHGTLRYPRSLRLSLSEYIALTARIRPWIHSYHESMKEDNFSGKNQKFWIGYNTWLHIVFNRSLCIFGLGLDENETFLRWLLIQRAKYFKRFTERNQLGWYVCTKKDNILEGKRMYLDYVGLKLIQLDSYEEIYERMLDL